MLIKSIAIVSFAYLSISVHAGEDKHKIINCFEYVPADTAQKILIYAIAYEPQTAGRLSCVCTAWNKLVNDDVTTQTVIMRNPKYYAENLVTAGCKKLNIQIYYQKKAEETFKGEVIHIDIDINELNEKNECNSLSGWVLATTLTGTVGSALVGFIGSLAINNALFYTAVPVGFIGGITAGFIGYHSKDSFKKLGCKC